jgi:pimeloyl-ACP methyl ester carboxylesterase
MEAVTESSAGLAIVKDDSSGEPSSRCQLEFSQPAEVPLRNGCGCLHLNANESLSGVLKHDVDLIPIVIAEVMEADVRGMPAGLAAELLKHKRLQQMADRIRGQVLFFDVLHVPAEPHGRPPETRVGPSSRETSDYVQSTYAKEESGMKMDGLSWIVRKPCVVAVAVVLFGASLLGVSEGPCSTDASSMPSLADLSTPNPLRAIVADELLAWQDWLEDGGFEEGIGTASVITHPASPLASVRLMRSEEAARSGKYGLRVETGPSEGGIVSLQFVLEKGEQTRCTFWVRSLDRSIDLPVSVLGAETRHSQLIPIHEPADSFRAGTEWAQVQFTFDNARGVAHAVLAIEVGPNLRLDLDDASIEAEQWKTAQQTACTRIVGGIPVPTTPAAPVHFNVLIHIEDPSLITQQEAYFQEKTAVFTELACLLHAHGGFLTIQPEEDWPLAASRFAPDTLAHLADRYAVVYSTHTHGPSCIDPDGRLRSAQDCNDCRSCPGWTCVETDADPYTPIYVGALRDLISEASGTQVSDHNGNWHYQNVSALVDVGIYTRSAYKNHTTQATFEELFINPWRPSACDAVESPDTFFIHDPDGGIIFVPGWGQSITRDPGRIHTRLASMLSQVLRFADPDRVNSFYIVTHVDHYAPDGEEEYITTDPESGALRYGDAFLADLACWEETLNELVDPLVAEGYLAWTSLPAIGELYTEWEETHSVPGTAPVSERRCGDGVCDGPETPGNCPADCNKTANLSTAGSVTALLEPTGDENVYWVTNPSSGARLHTQTLYPPTWNGHDALPGLVLMPGGIGTSDPGKAARLAAQGFLVVIFDADGRGRSEGTEDYNGFITQDGLAAVIEASVHLPGLDSERYGLISYSYGVTAAAGALARYPDLPVRFFIDWEGPVTREYTTCGCGNPSHGQIAWQPCSENAWWSEREALQFIAGVQVPYQRIQSQQDHVQPNNDHAIDIVNAAVASGVPWVRLNDDAPNLSYDKSDPPAMLSEAQTRDIDALIARYAWDIIENVLSL